MTKKYLSLGSNCCVATCLKYLNIREPSPFDWTNHFPINEIVEIKNNNLIDIKNFKYYFIHENLELIEQESKINNRLNIFREWLGDYVYLMEKESEYTFENLDLLNRLCSENQRIYLILSFNTNVLTKLNFSKIIQKVDLELLFSTNNLDNPTKMSEFLKNFLDKGV